MSELEERLSSMESRISVTERDFLNSWASGTRSEYEERFKSQIINEIATKIWVVLAAIIAVFGVAFSVYLNLTIDQRISAESKIIHDKLNLSINKEITEIQDNESERINELIDNFNWRQSHDFGFIYRNMAQIFWNDKTITIDSKKTWIRQVLALAIEKLEKANTKKNIKGETLWELGKLTYDLPLRYQLGTENPELAEKYYQRAISLYDKEQITKGWRGGAYEDLAKVQIALSKLHKGTARENEYLEKSKRSKKLALRDYEELVSKEHSWVNSSIIRIREELNIKQVTDSLEEPLR